MMGKNISWLGVVPKNMQIIYQRTQPSKNFFARVCTKLINKYHKGIRGPPNHLVSCSRGVGENVKKDALFFAFFGPYTKCLLQQDLRGRWGENSSIVNSGFPLLRTFTLYMQITVCVSLCEQKQGESLKANCCKRDLVCLCAVSLLIVFLAWYFRAFDYHTSDFPTPLKL